jgi:hypothetical protein
VDDTAIVEHGIAQRGNPISQLVTDSKCKNCDTPFVGIYCPACGQKNVDLERPMSELVGEVVKEAFDIDGRALRTVKTLFLRPGTLTREFLAGRRKAFTPPLRLYLVISISFFVVIAWVASRGLLLDPDQNLQLDAASQARFMADELPRLMFVLLPMFALLLKLAYWKRLYFDHIIFSIHLHSAAYVVLALMLPLEQVASEHWLPMVIQIVLFAYFLAYFVVALRRVYHSTWIIASAKSLVILIGYMVVVSGAIEATSNFKIMSD